MLERWAQVIRTTFQFIAMKFLCLIFFVLLTFNVQAQNELFGNYRNNFGDGLKLNSDYTFTYSSKFEHSCDWIKGKWHINNDTLYFQTIPIYDTLRYIDSKNSFEVDTLILSSDDKSELAILHFSIGEQKAIPVYMISPLVHQGISVAPNKLFHKNERLFEINSDGKLITEKQNWSGKLYDPSLTKFE